MNQPRACFNSNGRPKRGYFSEADATIARRRLRPRSAYNSYVCPHCKMWHNGRPPAVLPEPLAALDHATEGE